MTIQASIEESHGMTGPHLELSWKFQLLSSAKKCVKSSQRFHDSGRLCRGGGTHSVGSESFRDLQMSRCVHSTLTDGCPAPLSALLPAPMKIKDAWRRQGSSFLTKTHKFVHACM